MSFYTSCYSVSVLSIRCRQYRVLAMRVSLTISSSGVMSHTHFTRLVQSCISLFLPFLVTRINDKNMFKNPSIIRANFSTECYLTKGGVILIFLSLRRSKLIVDYVLPMLCTTHYVIMHIHKMCSFIVANRITVHVSSYFIHTFD